MCSSDLPIGTARVQQALYKLVSQLRELFQLSQSIELPYVAPRY